MQHPVTVMDLERIELSNMPCKGIGFPLAYRPVKLNSSGSTFWVSACPDRLPFVQFLVMTPKKVANNLISHQPACRELTDGRKIGLENYSTIWRNPGLGNLSFQIYPCDTALLPSPFVTKSRQLDSNQQPPHPKCGALPIAPCLVSDFRHVSPNYAFPLSRAPN